MWNDIISRLLECIDNIDSIHEKFKNLEIKGVDEETKERRRMKKNILPFFYGILIGDSIRTEMKRMSYKGFGNGMARCPKCNQPHFLPAQRIGENLYQCKCGANFRIVTKKTDECVTELV